MGSRINQDDELWYGLGLFPFIPDNGRSKNKMEVRWGKGKDHAG